MRERGKILSAHLVFGGAKRIDEGKEEGKEDRKDQTNRDSDYAHNICTSTVEKKIETSMFD